MTNSTPRLLLLSILPNAGDKYDLIDTSPTESESIAPMTPRRRRQQQPPLSSRLAELNEEFLIGNDVSS